jgi:glycosyltransferase involved in cell wall biosynthesis
VVDTGSEDQTIAIAKRFGSTVYEFDWCDDFSAARNYALDQLTTDFILVLDADERLGPGSGQFIRELISADVEGPGHTLYLARFENIDAEGPVMAF